MPSLVVNSVYLCAFVVGTVRRQIDLQTHLHRLKAFRRFVEQVHYIGSALGERRGSTEHPRLPFHLLHRGRDSRRLLLSLCALGSHPLVAQRLDP